MRVALIFPPGWSLMTGSPHLALPLLKASLEADGIEVRSYDLNWAAGQRHGGGINASDVGLADAASLEALNVPYFAVEDRLMAAARPHGGSWNAQIGFEYEDFPQRGEATALAALERSSPFEQDYEVLASSLCEFAPQIVGFSLAAVQQIVPALQFCRRLRLAGYDGFIALGGNTVSRLSEDMASAPLFDLVDGLVTFQGEGPLRALCRAVARGDGLGSVPNLVWRESGTVRSNGLSNPVSPNEAVCPDYSDLPVGRYAGINYLNVVGARGCYYGKCSFCAIPFGWGSGGFGGVRSPRLVVQDVALLSSRHGIRHFKFVDEALSPSFMREFSQGLLADGISIEWEGYTRLEAAWNSAEFVDLVASAGFRKGYFGLELAPSAGRASLQKNDAADPLRLLKLCSERGVRAHLFCMFGYPGTGREEAWATTDFVLGNQHLIDTVDIFPWTLAKHTAAPGVRKVIRPGENWALEFDHESAASGVLSSFEVRELATECEETVWTEAPRLLHPTYRLRSPWEAAPASTQAPTASLAVG